jgi:DNA-binding CsgD family transcriptional regulator
MHAVAAGALEVSLRNYAEALAHLGALDELQQRMGMEEPGIAVYHGDEIEALVETGDLERAETRVSDLERRGRELGRARALAVSARGRGLVLSARGDSDGATAAFEEALAHHERLPVPFERARTLLAYGRVLRRAKRRGAARDALAEAQAVFDELGAKLWAERTRAESARIGGRTGAGSALTPAEQQVAVHVAEGKTNKEVAAALFITVHTVERHLSHVYAKLGIRSRTELAARLSKE